MFHSDRLQKVLKISNFFLVFKIFVMNRENLIKIGRAGGKTSNRETRDQIGRVMESLVMIEDNIKYYI